MLQLCGFWEKKLPWKRKYGYIALHAFLWQFHFWLGSILLYPCSYCRSSNSLDQITNGQLGINIPFIVYKCASELFRNSLLHNSPFSILQYRRKNDLSSTDFCLSYKLGFRVQFRVLVESGGGLSICRTAFYAFLRGWLQSLGSRIMTRTFRESWRIRDCGHKVKGKDSKCLLRVPSY